MRTRCAAAVVAAVACGPAPARAALWRASYYGVESGRLNADGSRFNPMGFTAASKTLAFGTKLKVCLDRCAVVIVRDRGPYVAHRALDLAHGAARAIGLEAAGVADINVEVLGTGNHQSRGVARRERHSHHRCRRPSLRR